MLNISQDAFNKLVTLITMLFIMGVFVYSMVSGKPINISDVVAFISTLLATHGIHLVSNSVNQKTSASVTVAQTNGQPH